MRKNGTCVLAVWRTAAVFFFCFNGDGDMDRTSWGGKPNQTDVLSCVVCCPKSCPVPPPPNKNKRTELTALSSCFSAYMAFRFFVSSSIPGFDTAR